MSVDLETEAPAAPIAPYGWTIRDTTWQQNYGHFGRHVDAAAVRIAIIEWFAGRGSLGAIRPADLAVVELPADTSPLPLNPQWFERANLTPVTGEHFERYGAATRHTLSGAYAGTFGAVCACGELFLGDSAMKASAALTEHARREGGTR